MSIKHKLAKKTNISCLVSSSFVIESFKKMMISTLGTLRRPKRQTWHGFPMTQNDIEDFFGHMC